MPGRIRTFDRPIKSRMLYQLSYGHLTLVSAVVTHFTPQSTPSPNSFHFSWKTLIKVINS